MKATYDLSDEAVFQRWTCDPYFQFFSGEAYFQHRVPHERSGLSHWRNRLGADILNAMLRESLTVAQDAGALSKRDMEVVKVDTTVQEKSVRFPTDAALPLHGPSQTGHRGPDARHPAAPVLYPLAVFHQSLSHNLSQSASPERRWSTIELLLQRAQVTLTFLDQFPSSMVTSVVLSKSL